MGDRSRLNIEQANRSNYLPKLNDIKWYGSVYRIPTSYGFEQSVQQHSMFRVVAVNAM